MRRWKNPSTQTRATYTTWVNMRLRCTNPEHPQWKDYGGRGIFVCAGWLESYDEFYEYMGDRPAKHTIERINNDQGYRPGNCRWALMPEQNRNNRRTRLIEFQGETLPIVDWAARFGFTPNGMRRRLQDMPIEQALSSVSAIPRRRHGTISMYVGKKCRCVPCRDAYSNYQKERYQHGYR